MATLSTPPTTITIPGNNGESIASDHSPVYSFDVPASKQDTKFRVVGFSVDPDGAFVNKVKNSPPERFQLFGTRIRRAIKTLRGEQVDR